jgi:hypothetical protein
LIRSLILFSLVTTLILSLVTKGIGISKKLDDYPEDYGCVHDNHSQYDDGDSINLEYLNSVRSDF